MTRADFKKSLSFLLLCSGLIVAVMAMTPTRMQGAYNSFSEGSTLTLAVASPASVPDEIVWSETVTLQPHTTSEVVVSGNQVVALPWYNTTTNAISNNLDDCDAIIAICPDGANSTGNMFADIIWSAGPAPPLDVGSSAHALTPTNATGELKHFSRTAPWVGANCASKTYVFTGNSPLVDNRRGTKLNC